ncbi:aldehyde dehydrogenase family protein [Phytohabitans sp. ZYX-F-186]|uniref:Aldehyde dehydrogenase family protein n=1 Tax=Phytohabitans maris TaxID=3071409 RepID=A0ABU0ZWE2_9ACTN|nr:aldehyde dehydrogenase family protein [Phytohabitans sp. ZYX-F-186]MDQ7911358.1 aldehyde dehydrogenase family protein [Phytohabitans sp. ZYX-F-186]
MTSAATETSHDPRTGLPATTARPTSPAGLARTMARAVAAAAGLSRVPPKERARWLYAVADAVEAARDELVRLADWETALGGARLRGELTRTIAQLRFYADEAAAGHYLRVEHDTGDEQVPNMARVSVPLGPVAVFGASNFPFAFGVLGHDTASALAAGCPVVVKAHPAHLGVSDRLFEIARTALAGTGAPDGALGTVHGFEAGVALVQHPDLAAVAFTGSQAGGMALWRLANERPVVIPVFAEMGTVNPVAVTPLGAARLDEVARGLVSSFTLGHGQYCTKPGLVLAPRGEEFAARVAAELARLAPDPVMLTRGIADRVTSGIEALRDAGATTTVRLGGDGPGWSAPAAVLEVPLDQVKAGSRVLEEVFGAVVVVTEYDSPEQILDTLAQWPGALAATLVAGAGQDPWAARWLDALSGRVGRVVLDGWPTGAPLTRAQQHGGPWPATTQPTATSIGARALERFVRPVAYQGFRDELLPPAARRSNPWSLPCRVDGTWTEDGRS